MPPLRALVAAGHEVALVVTRVDKRRGRGGELTPEPGEGGRARARSAGLARRRRRARPARRRPRRRRRLRADHQAARARRAADGQPALLAAAALAWRGTGRAGAAGRRRRDRRVRDAVEEGLDTGGVYASARRCRSAPTTTAAELRDELVDVGAGLLVDTLEPAARDWIGEPTAAGRADVRGQVRRRRLRDRLGAAGRRRSTVWSVSAARGRRSAAKRLKIHRAPTSSTGRDRAVASVQPGGQGTDVVRGVAQRRPPAAERTVRRPVTRRPTRRRRLATARQVALDVPAPDRPRRRVRQPGARPDARASRGSATCDRRFVTELVYGTTRMRRACDALIDRFVTSPPDAATRTVLRLGAYQLAFAGVPPHAAVGETVGLAPKRTRGFVNAVLRKVARLSIDEMTWPSDGARLSYPDWIVDTAPRRARRRRRRCRRWNG